MNFNLAFVVICCIKFHVKETGYMVYSYKEVSELRKSQNKVRIKSFGSTNADMQQKFYCASTRPFGNWYGWHPYTPGIWLTLIRVLQKTNTLKEQSPDLTLLIIFDKMYIVWQFS